MSPHNQDEAKQEYQLMVQRTGKPRNLEICWTVKLKKKKDEVMSPLNTLNPPPGSLGAAAVLGKTGNQCHPLEKQHVPPQCERKTWHL